MLLIAKKEWQYFFSAYASFIAITIFYLVNGLVVFVFEDNIFEMGYASLQYFFQFTPWILLIYCAVITMKSFSEEYKLGTIQILFSLPLTKAQIIIGKFFGAFLIILTTLLPTLIYIFSIQCLSMADGIDWGETLGSYIGLLFLSASFCAIGVYISSLTNNAIIAFIGTLLIGSLLFYGFNALSKLNLFSAFLDYYIAYLGIDFHYANLRKGLLTLRDTTYFLSLLLLFFALTYHQIIQKLKQ